MRAGPSVLSLSLVALFALSCGASPAPPPPLASAVTPAPPATVPAGSPLVVITPRAITLDGAVVGDPRSIESTRKMQRIGELYTQLTQRRASASAKTSELWFDARDGGGLSAVSALMTAAFADYTSLHLKTSAGWVDGEWDPVRPTEHPLPAYRRILLRIDGDRATVAWQCDVACNAVPQNGQPSLRDLDGYLTSTCGDASPCVDIALVSFDSRVSFATAVDALAAVRRHGDANFGFRLMAQDKPAATPPERTCGEAITRGSHGQVQPSVIQQIVRANFGAMRACYEAGLKRKPDLGGKVVIRVAIGHDGHASDSTIVDSRPNDGGLEGAQGDAVTTLPDRAVAECVRQAFGALVFPKPENGKMTFVYPIVFGPGDGDGN